MRRTPIFRECRVIPHQPFFFLLNLVRLKPISPDFTEKNRLELKRNAIENMEKLE